MDLMVAKQQQQEEEEQEQQPQQQQQQQRAKSWSNFLESSTETPPPPSYISSCRARLQPVGLQGSSVAKISPTGDRHPSLPAMMSQSEAADVWRRARSDRMTKEDAAVSSAFNYIDLSRRVCVLQWNRERSFVPGSPPAHFNQLDHPIIKFNEVDLGRFGPDSSHWNCEGAGKWEGGGGGGGGETPIALWLQISGL